MTNEPNPTPARAGQLSLQTQRSHYQPRCWQRAFHL